MQTQATPEFSIIIGAYNDWVALDSCLRSLAQQTHGPSFEVILVDDGSAEPAPDQIRAWSCYYPFVIVRQPHAGVSAARNRGAQISKGSILVFADADSRFQGNCLEALASTTRDFPQHSSFQLRLTGDCSTLVGRVEELRLITLQDHLLQPDGCLRYLNTAGFATPGENSRFSFLAQSFSTRLLFRCWNASARKCGRLIWK